MLPVAGKDKLFYQSRYGLKRNNLDAHIAARIEEGEDENPLPPHNPGGGSTTCSRDGKEYIHAYKFRNESNVNGAEHWSLGDLEMKVYIWSLDKVVKEGRTEGNYFEKKGWVADRSDVLYTNWRLQRLPRTHTVSIKMFDWDFEKSQQNVGDQLDYMWVEEDGIDSKKSFELKLTGKLGIKIPPFEIGTERTAGVKWEVGRADVDLGTSKVYICDSEPDRLNVTALFHFLI